VAIFGGPRRAYVIDLDPAKLARTGLDARAVADAVRAAAEPHGAGTLVRGSERFDIAAAGSPHDAASLADVRVWGPAGRNPVRLGALGSARAGEVSNDQQASFDGTRAVLLSVYGAPGADAVALQRSAVARMTDVRHALPPDAAIDVAWDQTRPILASQASLRVEMLLGAVLALAVIFFFLRDRTLVAIAALFVPATFALTALVITRAGSSLNVMTLGGLAVAVGLVIDEAIVVVEAIARELAAEPGRHRRAAIASAVRRIARPLVAATAANVVVFLPLGLLSGVSGFFFRALSITLAVALLI
jgi:multidrug efflux pump subunit AcrB